MASTGCLLPLDDVAYCRDVLNGECDEDLDARLAQQASELGIDIDFEDLASSMSSTTISEPLAPRLSHSTGPTSCSSSECRPVTQSSDTSPPPTPSIPSTIPKKHRLSFRGIRKTFKRKTGSFSTTDSSPSIFQATGRSPMQITSSPVSPQDRSLAWSPTQSFSKLFPDDVTTVDKDAVRRTRDCFELQILMRRQLDERNRFLDFQHQMRKRLLGQQLAAKESLQEDHAEQVQKMYDHNEVLTDDLEQRQLQAEIDLRSELDGKKQAMLIRLRHMEAYCQSPSISPSSSGARNSGTSVSSFEEHEPRHVTDKDYRTLAATYRERDAMDGLHQSKIEVLRGKQERQLRDFTARKEREVDQIIKVNDGAEVHMEHESRKDLDALQQALDEKKSRLERRWKIASTIEVAKMEAKTGKTFALPDDLKIDVTQ